MKKDNSFYGWKNVFWLIIVVGIFGPATVAVANLFQPYVTGTFGIENSAFAVVNILMLGVGIFLSPVVSTKYATGAFKKIYLTGAIIYALGLFGLGLSPNIWVFYIVSIIVGAGYTITAIIPASLIVSNWFIKNRSLALSITYAGLGIGGMFFSQLLTYLLERIDWRLVYATYGLIMLVVCIPIIKWKIVVKPEDINQISLQEDSSGGDEKEVLKGVSVPVEEAKTKPFFWYAVLGAVLLGIVNNGGLGQFPPYMSQLHGSQAMALIVTIYSGVGILGKIVLGILNDRFGLRFSTIYSAILLVLTYLLAIKGDNYNLAIIMAICFGMGNAISTVLPSLVAGNAYPTGGYAEFYGYVNSGINLGMTLGSFVAASIADAASYTTAWITLGVVAVISAVLWLLGFNNVDKYREI